MRATLAIPAALMFSLPVHAAPPTADQKAEFYSICVSVSDGNTELCSCKADAAMTLTDARMLGYVIAGMRSGVAGEPADVAKSRATYIAKSNRACGLNY